MRSRERAVRSAVSTVLEHIRRRLRPGEGVSKGTRDELEAVRQMLVEGCRERGVRVGSMEGTVAE